MNPGSSCRKVHNPELGGKPQLPVEVHKYLGTEDKIKLLDLHDIDIWSKFFGNYNKGQSIVRKGFSYLKKKKEKGI